MDTIDRKLLFAFLCTVGFRPASLEDVALLSALRLCVANRAVHGDDACLSFLWLLTSPVSGFGQQLASPIDWIDIHVTLGDLSA